MWRVRLDQHGVKSASHEVDPDMYDGSQSLRPEFACDDNVHPNATGYRAMGESVDLALFSTDPK